MREKNKFLKNSNYPEFECGMKSGLKIGFSGFKTQNNN